MRPKSKPPCLTSANTHAETPWVNPHPAFGLSAVAFLSHCFSLLHLSWIRICKLQLPEECLGTADQDKAERLSQDEGHFPLPPPPPPPRADLGRVGSSALNSQLQLLPDCR